MVHVSYTGVDIILDSWKFKKNMRNRIKKSFNLDRIFKKYEKYYDLEVKAFERIRKREEK